MVSENKLLEILLNEFPDFEKIWEKENQEYWKDEDLAVGFAIIEFSRYVQDLITAKKLQDKEKIKRAFFLAENFMVKGDDKVKDLIATCFLENLINTAAWGKICPESFVHLLGEESKKYCKTWDEFTGVKTKGLWEEDK